MLMSAPPRTPPRLERPCSSAHQHHSDLLLSGRWGSTAHYTGRRKKVKGVNLDTHAAVFWWKNPSKCTLKRLCYSLEEFSLIWDLFWKVHTRVVEGYNSSMRQFWNKGVWSAVVSVVRRAVVLIKSVILFPIMFHFSLCFSSDSRGRLTRLTRNSLLYSFTTLVYTWYRCNRGLVACRRGGCAAPVIFISDRLTFLRNKVTFKLVYR